MNTHNHTSYTLGVLNFFFDLNAIKSQQIHKKIRRKSIQSHHGSQRRGMSLYPAYIRVPIQAMRIVTRITRVDVDGGGIRTKRSNTLKLLGRRFFASVVLPRRDRPAVQ